MITYHTKEGKFKSRAYTLIPFFELHKEDGPAVVDIEGFKEWWINGVRHRLNGPAIIHKNGTKEWFINGKKHRLDGPAVEYKDGYKYWYINGKMLNTNEVEPWIKNNNINLKTKQHQALFMLKFG